MPWYQRGYLDPPIVADWHLKKKNQIKTGTYWVEMHTGAGLDSGSGWLSPRRIERLAAALAERAATPGPPN
jgi:hypothetical protein